MTKKTVTRGAAAEPSGNSEADNALYTAHQVHTLVQITWQQLANSGRRTPNPAEGFVRSPGVGPVYPAQGASPTIVYWYP